MDDIADSGKSLKIVIDRLKEKKVKEVKTAVIHYKKRSVIIPDYWITLTDAWVIYPWEYYETIEEMIGNYKQDGLSVKEMRNNLITIGIPVSMIDSYMIHYESNK